MDKWVKGYQYTNVPKFLKRVDFLGYTFILQSHKTKRKRVGYKMSSDLSWNVYKNLLKG